MSWTQILPTLNREILATSAADIENNQPSGRIYPLESFSILEISGADRFSFLQGQATCDTQRLENGESLLGAHLNLKGRIEASFIAIPMDETLQLIMPNGQAAYLLSLLQKYALFSQVELKENQEALPYLHWTDVCPSAAFNSQQIPNIHLGICNPEMAEKTLADTELGSQQDAMGLLTRNGLLLVEQQHQGQYLPQELNYEQLDGISFNKGCYKGQEVVARIHFKGQVKQRLAPFISTEMLPKSAHVFNDSRQKCAEVITTYQNSDSSSAAFGCVLLKSSETESKTLHLEQNDAAKLRLVSLPYAIN